MVSAHRSNDLERLYRCIAQLNQVMNRGVELSVLLDTIVREAALLLNARTTSVLLLDEHRQRLLCSAAHGLSPDARNKIRFSPGEGIAGWTIDNAAPVCLEDAESDPRFVKFADETIRSILVIPLMIRGRPIGVICATHEQRGRFTKDHQSLLSFLANSIVLDVDNARLYRLAITDPLTGLYNRQHLAERLKKEVDRCHRYRVPLTVMMLDIDHFKSVNDQYGHAAGDQVLEVLGKRLKIATREVDFVARYGGEEFIILLPNTERAGAEHVTKRVLGSMRANPFVLDDGTIVKLTLSIGVAVLNDREEPRDLLARADAALYQAKSEGRDRYVFSWLSYAGVS